MSLDDHELQVLVNALENLTISWRHLLYPHRWPMPQIPHKQYNEKSSREAINLAAGIFYLSEQLNNKLYSREINFFLFTYIFFVCRFFAQLEENFVKCSHDTEEG